MKLKQSTPKAQQQVKADPAEDAAQVESVGLRSSYADTQFHPTLMAIERLDLEQVRPFLLPRSAPRKAQAHALRSLLKDLGLRDISVTVPTYSMASGVQVRLPKLEYTPAQILDHELARTPEEEQSSELARLRARHQAIREHFVALLDRAFPNHRNRSDYGTDYFDYCWMVD